MKRYIKPVEKKTKKNSVKISKQDIVMLRNQSDLTLWKALKGEILTKGSRNKVGLVL